MDRFQQYLPWVTGLFGLITIVLALILLVVMQGVATPDNGFMTPIIAFEFAQSEADLAFFADDPKTQDAFDLAHQWDMAFPIAYGVFLALLLVQLAQADFKQAWLFVPLALLAIPFDFWENSILIEITDLLRNGETAGHLLGRLHVATWLKWGMIGIGAGGIGLGMWQQGRRWSAGLGFLTFSVTVICWLLGSPPVLVEIMALLISIFFFWFAVKQFISLWHDQ